ncbi:hypothetical protein A2773_01415 [Candidatus Gottesmanbacteria bacterium RIFCSPHIGHO2_01_FULL_39_10]|uniref:Uncharacterized protein n=1 Tax=Candidatus Gottesmanbacteria bacterium RIFCSPHIGHO2_01_FULL_39_10 TaxID=1798375 RepID=A0A1F5ZN65_9BACT|nr:MAG: hypothetical protein A2773_01415 [Candidatus Gottesmanbacteria bacterium RIFCSPHIGHO2_01_FULL_39_10]
MASPEIDAVNTKLDAMDKRLGTIESRLPNPAAATTTPARSPVNYEEDFRRFSDALSARYAGEQIGTSKRDALLPVLAGVDQSISFPATGSIFTAPIGAGVEGPLLVGASRLLSRFISTKEHAINAWINIQNKGKGILGGIGNIIRAPARLMVNKAMEPGRDVDYVIRNKDRFNLLTPDYKEKALKTAVFAKTVADTVDSNGTLGWGNRALGILNKYREAGTMAPVLFKDLVENRAADKDTYAQNLLGNMQAAVEGKERGKYAKVVGASMLASIIPAAVTALGVDFVTGKTTALVSKGWDSLAAKVKPTLDTIGTNIGKALGTIGGWKDSLVATLTPSSAPVSINPDGGKYWSDLANQTLQSFQNAPQIQ